MRLLLLGCSGFVGRELVPFLLELGHSITLVSRRANPFPALASGRLSCLQLDPADPQAWQHDGLDLALAQADGVVNLAGEPIADKRWTPEHRELLLQSRLRSTANLAAAMAAMAKPPAVLVNGSAVGFYGSSQTARFTEASPAGSDYLAEICKQWEAAAAKLPPACRLVTLRIGIVLGPDGGALGKMLPVFRMGFGGPVGSGRQWMSWIHRHDLCRLIAAALEDSAYSGTYNAVGPEPTTMAAFAAALGRALGRPSLLPVPGPLLQLLLGDGAQVVLEGQQVVPERLQAQGFKFDYAELSAALAAATSPAPR
ncbi:TIGR01777 family oxidoreductase [Cyanobium sp. WAJ14-Wanaka]|uniref:TIGR01777 family oxidoreductase n=1 Tax=Cyanobium sp. WAJ14-Wanaka TaxID=2823725 RepID=UPI0020CC80A9|nr:TIGR01777 family oxidoreductase [Cyanobium sp. WAJ14-Wanaka]MCP9775307.1 TIGR01777 family oxidoreductase [Cyanobium sp. WAJ14-Wanaka]